MMFRTAIALLALAAPAFAQHGAHGGSIGSRGAAGHGGFSGSAAGHGGFSGSPGFSRSFVSPAPAFRYGAPSARNWASGSAGFHGAVPPNYRSPFNPSFRIPPNGNRFSAGRAPYNPAGAGRSGDRNHDRFDRRRRSFNNWYTNYYPTWPGYGYPYVIDPGFYDWGDTDSGDSGSSEDDSSGYASSGDGNSGYDASAYDQGGPAPAYPASYPDEGFRPPYQPSAASAPVAAAAPLPNQPLTVIFKDGRAPVRMQNYMMTPTVLTDLDAQHYEQIPLDQVDEAATRQVNSAAGVYFRVPGAARD